MEDYRRMKIIALPVLVLRDKSDEHPVAVSCHIQLK